MVSSNSHAVPSISNNDEDGVIRTGDIVHLSCTASDSRDGAMYFLSAPAPQVDDLSPVAFVNMQFEEKKNALLIVRAKSEPIGRCESRGGALLPNGIPISRDHRVFLEYAHHVGHEHSDAPYVLCPRPSSVGGLESASNRGIARSAFMSCARGLRPEMGFLIDHPVLIFGKPTRLITQFGFIGLLDNYLISGESFASTDFIFWKYRTSYTRIGHDSCQIWSPGSLAQRPIHCDSMGKRCFILNDFAHPQRIFWALSKCQSFDDNEPGQHAHSKSNLL